MDKEKEIEEMANELHSATNENYVSCLDIARILVERCGYTNDKQFKDEIERLKTERADREEDLMHTNESIFYHESNVVSHEDEIKTQDIYDFMKTLEAKINASPEDFLILLICLIILFWSTDN